MRRWVVVGLVLAATLVGCGGQSAVHHGDVAVFVHGRSLLPGGGDDAIVEGTLLVRDGCVLLAGELGESFPVVWPSGTSIADDDPLTLELPSGEALGVGQVVRGGGGFHQTSSDRVEVDVPARCVPGSGQVAVFNPDDDPSVVAR